MFFALTKSMCCLFKISNQIQKIPDCFKIIYQADDKDGCFVWLTVFYNIFMIKCELNTREGAGSGNNVADLSPDALSACPPAYDHLLPLNIRPHNMQQCRTLHVWHWPTHENRLRNILYTNVFNITALVQHKHAYSSLFM